MNGLRFVDVGDVANDVDVAKALESCEKPVLKSFSKRGVRW